jgi:hypothetical protein
VEDVDNHFEIVEHDPLAGREAVDRSRADVVIFLQSRFDFVRDRFELRFRRCRTDDEKIGKGGDAGKIENDDLFGLLVRSELRAGRG